MNNNTTGQVSPAMSAFANNWNKFAKQFARRFQHIRNKSKAGIVTEEDLRNQYRKIDSNPVQTYRFYQ